MSLSASTKPNKSPAERSRLPTLSRNEPTLHSAETLMWWQGHHFQRTFFSLTFQRRNVSPAIYAPVFNGAWEQSAGNNICLGCCSRLLPTTELKPPPYSKHAGKSNGSFGFLVGVLISGFSHTSLLLPWPDADWFCLVTRLPDKQREHNEHCLINGYRDIMGHTFQLKQWLFQQPLHHHQSPDHLLANVWSSLLQPTDTYWVGWCQVGRFALYWASCNNKYSVNTNLKESVEASVRPFVPASLWDKLIGSLLSINISSCCVHTDTGGTAACHSVWSEVRQKQTNSHSCFKFQSPASRILVGAEGLLQFDLKVKHHLLSNHNIQILFGRCSQWGETFHPNEVQELSMLNFNE